MMTNCNLENKGWIDQQDGGDLYLKHALLLQLGELARFRTMSECNMCDLSADCKAKPLMQAGRFVGVTIDTSGK